MKIYEYETTIQKVDGIDGAYVIFPYDIKKEFGKGRLKIKAIFESEIYNGSVVNMGVKNANNSICYIIGIPKEIRRKINKQIGDKIKVSVTPI